MKNVLLNSRGAICGDKKGKLAALASWSSRTLKMLSLISVFCIAAFSNANAQQVTVRGSVKDAAGMALLGVGVKVKDAATTTSTDASGLFSINAPATGTLVFSYVGYETREVAIAGKTSIDVVLTESAQNLDEVVVTALGVTKSRRQLTSSVQDISGDKFTQARDNNIATALTGRIAGLDAAQINAGPGSSSKVTIRGANLLSSGGNNQPLYVVDGVPIRNSSSGANTGAQSFNVDRGDGISMFNPDDIETISVLKGGQAAALYGSSAANGVILITTKSGKAGSGIGVELNSNANLRTPSIYPVYQYVYGQGDGIGTAVNSWQVPTDIAGAQRTGRLSFGPKMNSGVSYLQVDGQMHPLTPVSVKDNINNFYNQATDITNSVAFSGGNDKFTSRLSFTDLRSNAQQPNSGYNRQGGVLNTSAKLGRNDAITIQGGLNYTTVEGKNRPNVGYAEFSADWPVYLIANTVDIRSLAPGVDATGTELQWNLAPEATNPYFLTNYMANRDKSQRFIMNADVKFKILNNLSVRVWGNRDYQMNDAYNYTPLGKRTITTGSYASSNETNWNTQIYSSIDYNTSFLKDFSVAASLGGNQFRSKGLASGLYGIGWIIPNFFAPNNLTTIGTSGNNTGAVPTTTAGSARNESRGGTNSAFGSINLDWKRVVFLEVTGRNDWFSSLLRGYNSIFYPSVGTSVIVSDLVKMPSAINMFKVRGSWAQVGLATVNASDVRQTYGLNSNNVFSLPVVTIPNSLANPQLRPLTVDTYEGGFEMQMLGGRLGLDATYYNKTTKDDILQLTLSPASGYSSGRGNAGSIRNQGLELMLNGTLIRNTSFNWAANLNFTLNRSKVVSLAENVTEVSLGTGVQGPRIVNRVGLPYSTLYGVVELRNAAGLVVFNPTTRQALTQEIALGSGYQPYLYGMNNDFRYKAFSLNVFVDAKFGGVAHFNLPQYATRFGLTEASLVGRENGLTINGVTSTGGAPYNTPFAAVYTVGNDLYTNVYNRANAYPGNFVYSTDFVKLRRVALTYNIPVNKLKTVKLKGASISLTGQNLLRLYYSNKLKDIGVDPEMQESNANAQGTSGVSAPVTRVWGANLRLTF